MNFRFKAKIEKAGINPCVKVPLHITLKMLAVKGYIPVEGTINDHPFEQTLCPVKNDLYRLYVNGPMMKGANVEVGNVASFNIKQADKQKDSDLPMIPSLEKSLVEEKLFSAFQQLTPSRKKEILRYLHGIKTKEALRRNIEKLVVQLAKFS